MLNFYIRAVNNATRTAQHAMDHMPTIALLVPLRMARIKFFIQYGNT